jgi:hypothetical protein
VHAQTLCSIPYGFDCLAVLHTSPVPAIVLGLLNALIVYLRRDELASFVRLITGRS